jgi:hypothetical protein
LDWVIQVEQMKKAKAKKAGAPAAKKDDATAEEPSSSKSADGSAEQDDAAAPSSPTQTTGPSLAEQSKARSTSFRKASISSAPISPGVFSPEGETAPDIYRKHVAKIDELEKENKRLAKEATDAEKRWKKAEEELTDLREADGDAVKSAGAGSEVEKLV